MSSKTKSGSARKSTRKSTRKSARKSTRKSARKSTRKSARKSTRKSARKSSSVRKAEEDYKRVASKGRKRSGGRLGHKLTKAEARKQEEALRKANLDAVGRSFVTTLAQKHGNMMNMILADYARGVCYEMVASVRLVSAMRAAQTPDAKRAAAIKLACELVRETDPRRKAGAKRLASVKRRVSTAISKAVTAYRKEHGQDAISDGVLRVYKSRCAERLGFPKAKAKRRSGPGTTVTIGKGWTEETRKAVVTLVSVAVEADRLSALAETVNDALQRKGRTERIKVA